MTGLDPALVRDLVRRALDEDGAARDLTTAATVPADARGHGTFVARSRCRLAGLDCAREVFAQLDARVVLSPVVQDGEACDPGAEIAHVRGPAAALLSGERTALNFLQHLSGIATLTRRFVDAAGGRLEILDTRKTVPGLRPLAKYAVRCGGGTNHRRGLDDGVLIKDNHIRLAGGIAEAVRRMRAASALPVEVEAQSLDDVDAAIAAGADTIMLDNLSDDDMADAIRRIARRARVEISGGITLDRLPALARLGADCVSVGALTHSAPAADISLEIETDAHLRQGYGGQVRLRQGDGGQAP
jgi:nicotinate-nucleotide pyrophosphorylase (carboxylating)